MGKRPMTVDKATSQVRPRVWRLYGIGRVRFPIAPMTSQLEDTTMKSPVLLFSLVGDNFTDAVVAVRCLGCGRTWKEHLGDISRFRNPDTGILDGENFEACIDSVYDNIRCECES